MNQGLTIGLRGEQTSSICSLTPHNGSCATLDTHSRRAPYWVWEGGISSSGLGRQVEKGQKTDSGALGRQHVRLRGSGIWVEGERFGVGNLLAGFRVGGLGFHVERCKGAYWSCRGPEHPESPDPTGHAAL